MMSCNLPYDRADPLVRDRIFTMTTPEYVDGELLERYIDEEGRLPGIAAGLGR
jgi:hypothetical protein